MPVEQITDEHLDLIADRIFESRCVPFLGAGANVSRKKPEYEGPKPEYDGLPLGTNVAAELVKLIRFEGGDPSNLPRVALQYEIKKDRPDLITKLKKIIPEHDRDPSPLLRTLARLPFRLIVTTNYDRLLERALNDLNKNELIRDYVTIVQSEAGILIQTREGEVVQDSQIGKKLEELQVFKGLLLYKLHGTFCDVKKEENEPEEEISPLIVTEDDYISFLTVAGMEGIGVPRLITKNITPNTLLFLGYSLEDWDFRTIHRGLIKTLSKHQKRQSFAIQKKPADYWVTFWEQQGIKIYDIDLYDFAELLESRYQTKYGQRLDEEAVV